MCRIPRSSILTYRMGNRHRDRVSFSERVLLCETKFLVYEIDCITCATNLYLFDRMPGTAKTHRLVRVGAIHSERADMKITEIEALPIAATAGYPWAIIVVLVRTDEGLTGIGE